MKVRVNEEEYEFPDELYYEKDHAWAKIEDGRVKVGIDDFAQKAAGKIIFLRLLPIGREVKQKKSIGTLESGKWVGSIRAPVSGRIVEVNKELLRKPSIANEDPYGQGWMVIVEPSNLEEELKNLFHRETMAEWAEKDIRERLKK